MRIWMFKLLNWKKKGNYIIFYVNVWFIGEKMVLISFGKEKGEFEIIFKNWSVYEIKI